MADFVTMLKPHVKNADFWSFFILHEAEEEIGFRKGIQMPLTSANDRGALITVMKNGGIGYCSTQDLSAMGIKWACDQAFAWAERFSSYSILQGYKIPFSKSRGSYVRNDQTPLSKIALSDKIALLREADEKLAAHHSIVDTEAALWSIDSTTSYYNSLGAEIYQEINRVVPSLSATANSLDITQIRTLGGMRAYCRQGGYEFIKDIDLLAQSERIREEALELVHAENCPSGVMDALIDPDQMMLQIHESIGHPLELDRILGDERNYAGTSFVTLSMFGNYRYGSDKLNITFDPTVREEFASYGFDDEGAKAEKTFLIESGILQRPLGGTIAQARAGMRGVANARSSSWNRPPIDRMANLNLEPGNSSFADMLNTVEKGVYLKSNASWSIDDSRNKFQFGCEWGQLIENGRLTKVVRNPNYRGISANFWRSLKMVGDPSSVMVMGSPYCGKGEPNQCIRVGHSSPACLFENIDIFGGE